MPRLASVLTALGISALSTIVMACGDSDVPLSETQVVEATIDMLGDLMSSGELTSRRLTEIYLARIERYDRRGPRLNSLLEVNPGALAIADSLDRERRENGPRSPLHGIPVILKDAMATADQMRTSNGSYLLMDAVVTQDATVAHKLRESGALILAKANMDEMACCNGVFSGRGGGVRNPYDLDRFASGSSSGSAASVAANLAVVSLGGDTRSSIRFPASVTSLVGLKPTTGLISRAGVIPGDVHLDVVGPMARTVTDVAIVTGILAGFDQRDPYTLAGADHALDDYRPFLQRDALVGVRIGIARQGFFGFSPAIDSVTEDALRVLEREGAILVDSVTIEAIPYAGGREDDANVLRASASWALDQYLKSLSSDSPIRSLNQLRAAAWLGRYPTNFAPGFARRFAADTANWNPADYPLDRPEVTEAFERFISEQRDQVMAVLQAEELSAIVFPTTSRLTGLLIPAVQPWRVRWRRWWSCSRFFPGCA